MSNFVWSRLIVAVLIVSGVAASPTRAEEAPAAEPGAESPWRGEFTARIWLMGLEGDLAIGTVSTDIDADFGDVFDASDSLFALSGRLEVGYGKFAGFVDGIYVDLGVDDVSGALGLANIDVTMELGVIDFGAMYRAYEGPLLGDKQPAGRATVIDVYAGGRYITVDVELDPAAAPTRSNGEDWVDPIIGARIRQPLTDWLHVEIAGDLGGFGVASDLTWSATGLIGIDFEAFNKLPMTVYGGYRAIGWDYGEGSGSGRFHWDIILHGPTLGLRIGF